MQRLPCEWRDGKPAAAPPTRLLELAKLTYHPERGEKIYPLRSAPWRKVVKGYGERVRIHANKEGIEKEAAVRAFETLPDHLAAYSDGSLLEAKQSGKRCVGYGVAGYHRATERLTRVRPTGAKSEVHDAETAGLAWALTSADSHPGVRHLHFFADNTAALAAILDPKRAAGQMHAGRFRRYVEESPGTRLTSISPQDTKTSGATSGQTSLPR